MKCLKVGSLPSKADPDEQEDYKEKKLEPRLNEAKEGKRAVFFVDAAHFVMGAFLGFVWCFERLFVKSPSGRKRFNVLGALNAITHEVILVTNDTYITATQVCELLEKIAALGLMIPITLVLDNARYQKCKAIYRSDVESCACASFELVKTRKLNKIYCKQNSCEFYRRESPKYLMHKNKRDYMIITQYYNNSENKCIIIKYKVSI